MGGAVLVCRPGAANPASYPAYLTGLTLAATACTTGASMNVLVAKCKVGWKNLN